MNAVATGRLLSFTVFVAVNTVERGAAMAGSRIVECRDVKAPSELAARNVGTALAVDELSHTVARFAVSRVWTGEPTPGF